MAIFVNREKELKSLEEWMKKGKIAIITGRRRVGKSRLILEFIKNKKALYLLAAEKSIEYNLRKFSEEISKKFKIPGLRFKDFEEMFEFLESRNDIDIIVIDEFGYLLKSGMMEIQRIVDKILKNKKLILLGSLISVMETKLIGYRSPLYGRADLIKRVLPLKFFHILDWFPSLDIESAIKLYSVTGGVPKYLEFFEGKNINEEIEKKMFNPDILLFRDAKLILEEELPEPMRYFLILESIALGKNKLSEISNYSKIDINQLPYYLTTLKNLKFIIHEKPIMGGKKGVYRISDHYINFWFLFISPFFEEIESNMKENAINNFRKNFNSYLGFVFEDVCKEFLTETKIFPFTKMGKWWHRDKEIDMLALNEKTKEVLFCECKWKSKANAKKLCKELAEKSSYVQWHNEERKESFAIFAKSFRKRIKEFEGKKVYCFDLKDLEKMLKSNKRVN